MRNKKQFIPSISWLATIIVCLLLVGGTAVVVFWPRQAGSEEYRHYSEMEGVKASYFKDFRINDTLTVDVTLLEAEDSDSWETLVSDFNVPELPLKFKEKIRNGEDVILSKFIMDSIQTASSFGMLNAVIVTSFLSRTLTIFHITTDEELHAIMQYNYPSLKYKNN